MALIIPATLVPWCHRRISSFTCLVFQISFNNGHCKWTALQTDSITKNNQLLFPGFSHSCSCDSGSSANDCPIRLSYNYQNCIQHFESTFLLLILLLLSSSGQSCWLHIRRSLVLCLALLDFQRSSGSGRESTQPREYN
jgi:hypothetical protein